MLKRKELFAEAVFALQRAINLRSDDPKIHYDLGHTLYGMGELGKAIASFRNAIVLNPKYAEAHSNLANCYTAGGQHTLARFLTVPAVFAGGMV